MKGGQCHLCDQPLWGQGLCEKHYRDLPEVKARYLEQKRLAYAADPQKYRDRVKQWAAANPGKVYARNVAYKEKNPDDVRRWGVVMQQKRRALIKGVGGSYTGAQLLELEKLQKGRCAVCRKPFGKNYHADHIEPIVRGGSNDILNIQLLCPKCNRAKSAKDPIAFMQSRGMLL